MTADQNQGGRDVGLPAYRLREPVRRLRNNGQPVFMLSYPLKAVRLHPAWIPVGEKLSSGKFVPLTELETLTGAGSRDRVRLFLDDLARRGFLECLGVPALSSFPKVSVIVPVRNRPEEIRSCLEALLQVDYPPESMEILVVDDASTDRTAEVVAEFPVTLIRLAENRQASFCRNLGARRAAAEILAFIDSDCLPSSSWLRELVPLFQDRSLAAVGGKVDSFDEGKRLDRYEQVMSSLNGGNWPRRSSAEEPFFYVPSCNLLVRREAFLAVGGFQEDLLVGEDVDLCWRLQDRGHPVEYRPLGIVYHRHRNRMKDFCSRRFDYGTSEPLLQKRHPRRIKIFGFPPAGALFWAVLFLSLYWGAWATAAVLPIAAVDAFSRKKRLQQKDLLVALPLILVAVLRDYLALFYQACAFLSRYYLAPGLLLIPLLPPLSLIVPGVQLLTGSVVYIVRRPRLNFLSFQIFFLLEQLSYQAGVWWGCLKNLHFTPVAPKPVGFRTPKGLACRWN